jgi:capsular polysaccharide transport system permease protein
MGANPALSSPRTPLDITVSVWKALFLREAVTRLSTGRAAWLWLLLEPLVHIVMMLFIFVVIRMRVIGGIDTTLWLMVGMTAYLMFQRTSRQTQNAVVSNQGLFTYRQVKPIDTVLVRAALEGFLTILVAVILFSSAALFGISDLPYDPLAVLEAFFGLWLVGMGFGMITSVVGELIPELEKIIDFFMTPIYFASGVIFPIADAPQPYRDWLFLNPIANGLEAARLGFAPYYHSAPEVSIAYIYGFALVTIFLGLALHIRFSAKLVAQ